MVFNSPPCPASLRSIQHYLKTAQEHDERDPVVSYWCRLYALQTALKIDKKSDEAKSLLMCLMDWLESTKKSFSDNELITNEMAAQAYIENYSLKLFFWADGQDREAVFNKNVVKTFYSAGILMDVLSVFGEVSEEIVANRKYAKWKAAYIHNCLKNGETPVPGPLKDDDESESSNTNVPGPNFGFQVGPTDSHPDLLPPRGAGVNNLSGDLPLPPSGGGGLPSLPDPPTTYGGFPSPPSAFPQFPNIPAAHNPPPVFPPTSAPAMPVTPSSQSVSTPSYPSSMEPATLSGGKLSPEKITKAQKYCKWAGSALNYDDVTEAVSNLRKALRILETGEDS
ncbi:vacuolar protein sorting-associated protein VTA1 homolog [Nilaparvata lugens]|uniref:vacuolar protein sorting-associated protein VTA1 homolog n=1 Tax=Nilaparvata lugens TaxID=108931 RepID=UPI00193D83E8|nr:vacuolar protein sorting-associated protein VTA1 homolog [Nilaparvata lugens]